ncbi:DUF4192 family protein [Glycomyces sp. MUSA5-2]|uniref:DUF4192 family protein n=1 Tax=Glycomyces sp. MUSA5-2 TaxID=2053002 RepID=UPI00300BAF96
MFHNATGDPIYERAGHIAGEARTLREQLAQHGGEGRTSRTGHLPRLHELADADPGVIAALVPHLLNEPPEEALVAIALGLAGPLQIVAAPLHHLRYEREEELAEFSEALSRAGATRGWLIGFAADPTDVAEAVVRVGEFHDALDFIERSTALIVTNSGTRYGRLAESTDSDLALHTEPLPDLDPAWARLTAIAICAHGVRAARMQLFGLPEGIGELDQLVAANDQIARLRMLAASADAAALAVRDRAQLDDLLSRMRPLTAPEAINLSTALATDSPLFAAAVNHILDGTHTAAAGCHLWNELTRHAYGPARTACAALAALAAWDADDSALVAAARAVMAEAEELPPAVAAIADVLDAGAATKDSRSYLRGA